MGKNAWMRNGFDSWLLGVEALQVITLRTLKLAAGGAAAQTEAQRMVNEKIAAGLDLQMRALTGGLGVTADGATAKVLAHYRRKVRANRRRLSKMAS
ncbi:hypothetical protein [Nitrospirillum pindoramense]|uniref:Uncharacterized protein n=1 Tax=Nitrospirillum amazonense TaxID=28077 RepID=A0A560H2D1_9PROT|nr:hypothetical protein [Nitrospirillum amazonense]TWB40453.1 hypothetical protein FBZ90_10956 [Nitrospirillum amazonense]